MPRSPRGHARRVTIVSASAPSAASAVSPACALAAVEEVLWAARALRDRIDALAVRAGRVEDAVQWQSPSARVFRDRADDLHRAVRAAQSHVDAAVDGLRATRARIVAGTLAP